MPPVVVLLHFFLNRVSFWDRPKLSISSLTQSHQAFSESFPSNSFNFPRYTTFDPIIIIFSFNMSKPSQPTLFDHRTDWFQSYGFLTFLPFIQLNPTHPSDHTHFSAIQLQFMFCFHRPGLTAMHQTTPHTQLVYIPPCRPVQVDELVNDCTVPNFSSRRHSDLEQPSAAHHIHAVTSRFLRRYCFELCYS